MEFVHVLVDKMNLERDGSRVLIHLLRCILNPAYRCFFQRLCDALLEIDM
jgi:hypothetical protein